MTDFRDNLSRLVRGVRTAVLPASTTPEPPATVAARLAQGPVTERERPTARRPWAWQTPAERPRHVEALAPCSSRCPAGNDVVGFVQALAREGLEAAAAVLARTTPFPSVCGRVCPGFCMKACNRRGRDGAVDTRAIERWIGDHAPPSAHAVAAPQSRRRVAIVGGGPAGLSAAYQLAHRGHEVTVFEAEPALGGVLRTGIPSYRLPRSALDRDIGSILALGVRARCGTALSREEVAALASDYDGVVIATGLQRLHGLDIDGAGLDGVEEGLRFLHRMSAGRAASIAGHVVVLGGGNTAMDCARSALRHGADRVTVAYRRTRAEMPAIPDELHEAEEEGVALALQRAPVAFEGIGGRVSAVLLAAVEPGPPDASGRRQPVVTSRVERVDCDHVLLAVGQSADRTLLPIGWELHDGRLHRGGEALTAFVCGDLCGGEGTVVHAIGSGRRAAEALLESLGEAVAHRGRVREPLVVRGDDVRFGHFPWRAPSAHRREDPVARVRDFREVDAGIHGPTEAARCYSCGDCTRCDACLAACPDGNIAREGEGYAIDLDLCRACGACVLECPRGAVMMIPA